MNPEKARAARSAIKEFHSSAPVTQSDFLNRIFNFLWNQNIKDMVVAGIIIAGLGLAWSFGDKIYAWIIHIFQ